MGEDGKLLLVADETRAFGEAKRSDDGTWDVCCITPGWGSSGYYSEDLLKTDGVAVLKEGLQMFWDHATTREEYERPERSLRDLAGVLAESARYDEKGWNGPGLYAKAKVFPMYEEQLGDPAFAEAIGLSLVSYGISHVGEAEGETGDIIDQITAARSVDFVTLPGRGGKVKARFESLRQTPKPAPKKETPKKEARVGDEEARQLREAQRKLEDDNRKLTESLNEKTKENDRLTKENGEYKESLARLQAKDIARTELGKVKGIPKATKARLVESIAKAAPLNDDGNLDKRKLDEAIEDAVRSEAEYLKELGFGKVRGLGGRDFTESEDDDDDPEDEDEDDDDDDDDDDEGDRQESRRIQKRRRGGSEKRLESAFTRLTGNEKTAKLAAAGRS